MSKHEIDYREAIAGLNAQLADIIDQGAFDDDEPNEITITVCGECDDEGHFVLDRLWLGEADGGTWVGGNEFNREAKAFIFEKPEDLQRVIDVHVEFAYQDYVERRIAYLTQEIESIEARLADPHTNPHDPFIVEQSELLNVLQDELHKFEEQQ